MDKVLNILIFILILFLIFLLSFFDYKFKFRNKKRILFIFTIAISIICGFRVIGLDLEPYRVIFNNNQIVNFDLSFIKNIFLNKLEPAFVILISWIKAMGLGFNSFLLISAILPMYMIYLTITKVEKERQLITFFLFLMLMLFRGPVDTIRHFFAAVIYLSGIYSLSQNNRFGFYTKSFLSIFFHYSNVAVLFIKPFLNIKWTIKRFISTLIIVGIISFISRKVLVEFFTNISFKNQIMWKFQYYLVYGNERYEYLNVLHEILLFIMNYSIVFFNVFIILWGLTYIKNIEQDKFYKYLLNSQIIGTILVVFFSIFEAATIGLRLNFLFSIGSFLLVKEILFQYYTGKKITAFIFILIFLSFYNLVIILYFAGIHNPNSFFSII